MTLREELLIHFFKILMEQDFDEWYLCDIEDNGKFIKKEIESSKEVISNKTKVFLEYLDVFSKTSGLDMNTDYNENNSLATDLLFKALTEKKF